MTRYYIYDHTLYRDANDTLPNEAWLDGEWKRIVPSEQDYEGMHEVDEADALRHQAADAITDAAMEESELEQ